MPSQPHISVLMTSYNHAPYVRAQVDSILAQTWRDWDLTISDNGSTDGSWEILKRYEAENHDRVRVVRGPGTFPGNHFNLVTNADPEADYYAWCDSDDIWLPGKLAMAMEIMGTLGQGRPALYCSRLLQFDDAGRDLGMTPACGRVAPCFGNALAQSVASGQTEVFNRPARELIALGLGLDVPYQDWFAYQIVSGAGGIVVHDPRPTARYRVHVGNTSRPRVGIRGWLALARVLLGGVYQKNLGRSLAALGAVADRLTPENRERLAMAARLHQGEGGPLKRLALARRIGLCRQSRAETAYLHAMAALGLL